MMFTSKNNIFLVFALLTCASFTQSMHRKPIYPQYGASSHDSSFSDTGKIALGVGCLAAFGYGLYKVCDWFFTPSNEQIIKDAATTIHEAHKRTHHVIDFFENNLGIPYATREKKRLISHNNEPLLYQFSLFLMECGDSIEGVSKTIENSIYYLNQSRNALTDRIKNLYKRPEFPGIITQLESLENEIAGMMVQIEFVHDYLGTHKKYFNLYELERKLLNSYAQEIDAIERYAGYQDSLYTAIKMCVMKYANMHQASYPYMKYIEVINNNCGALERLIAGTSFSYTNRLSAANLLAQKLRTIYSMLLITDAYHQEMRDYERAQLERQRIEAERAKAAAVQAHAQAAQAQAAAAQQQMWAMHQHNALKAEKNRIDQEHNAILVAQTIVNAVVPPPAPQYNIFFND